MRKILLCLVAVHAASAALPVRPYKIDHYGANLALDFDRRRIQGEEIITVRSTANEALAQIELDASEIAVTSIRAGKAVQTFSQSLTGRLIIHFNKPLQPHQIKRLTLRFSGTPTKGLQFAGRQAFTVYNTSHWLVVNHEPSNLASFRLSLTVPAGLVVIANGTNTSSKTLGSKLVSVWDEKRAIPDFVMGFAVGPFQRNEANSGGTAIRCFSQLHTEQQMAQQFRSTPKALAFFAGKAGVPYPSKTYSQVLVSGNPEQELGDFTLLPESYGTKLLSHPDDEWLMAHELAHQWWGIRISCNEWGEFWLNEGVATFMADVFLGERYGVARYNQEMEAAHQIFEGLKAAGKDHPLCYAGRVENEVGGRLPYNKGAWVLHLLKEQLGEDIFWQGFKEYSRKNWGRTATSKDLQAAMESAAGASLEPFFNEWVYR